MATVSAIQPARQDSTVPPNLSPTLLNFFQHGLALSDLDFKDNRYPTLSFSSKPSNGPSSMILASGDARDVPAFVPSDTHALPSALGFPGSLTADPTHDKRTLNDEKHDTSTSQPSGADGPIAVPYALPGGARRPAERYSLDDYNHNQSNGTASPLLNGSNFIDPKLFNDSFKSFGDSLTQSPPSPPPINARDMSSSLYPGIMRQSSYALPDGVAPSKLSSTNGLSSARPYSPTLAIPISSNPRVYPQHPTYITPAAAAPDPINPVFSPNPPQQQEEICVECAMRDQDMADVVVVGPGIWDRESDVLFEELLRREEEEEASGVVPSECSSRPRARGGRLTEQNLKLWTTMTPREPTSRQQTVDAYVKAQRSLLEAEALAHARAMQESMQLENSVRDTYSQLRSAYDLGGTDDSAFKLKPPRATSTLNGVGAHHIRSSSRDITLLDNGLIVEHVNVRREEREEKERRRRQEKRERSRPRKSSRGSVVDVTSLYSTHSLAPHTDSGFGPVLSSRYSAVSMRPASSLTVPIEAQPSLSQLYSQASFSDAHSPGSASPRRSRFFGFRNLSSAWRSQDSLAHSGMSGSMIDMQYVSRSRLSLGRGGRAGHVSFFRPSVALQREANPSHLRPQTGQKSTLSTQRHSQLWPPTTNEEEVSTSAADEKTKKKHKGLAKIWKLVKGGSSHKDKDESPSVPRDSLRSLDRNDDDSPLAPPPPLSYLVERGPGEHLGGTGARHASTPSLPSTTSPRNGGLSSAGMSPSTAPTSLLPSPTTSRPSAGNGDGNDRKNSGQTDEKEALDHSPDENGKLKVAIHPVTSEPDMRQRLQQATFTSASGMTLPRSAVLCPQVSLSREKSLPPLPGEVKLRAQHGVGGEQRPQTLYTTYDLRHLGQDLQDLAPPHAPFRNEARRQSFGGTGTRPNLGIQTMPLPGGNDRVKTPNGMYSEFGVSRRSLGRLGDIDENPAISLTPTKRKSKFGFAALLGKKSSPPVENGYSPQEFPRLTSPVFDPNDDPLAAAYPNSLSRLGPRLSVASRKAIEERVEQDREFVAYRYPSQTRPPVDLIR